MLRLTLLALVIVATAVTSHVGFAQQSAKIPRIGFLGPAPPPPPATSQLDIFRAALADLGYVEGRNIIIDVRFPEAGRLDLLPDVATALIGAKADLIFAIGGTAARVAAGATADIPIVFAGVIDPVAAGLVPSMERPGKNLTGATTFDPQLARKQLEILREVLPGLTSVAVLGDSAIMQQDFENNAAVGRSLGLHMQIVKVERSPNPDFDAAFAAAKSEGARAVVVLSTPVTTPNRRRIAEAAMKYQLPILSPREHADAGGMISFGTGFSMATRRAATHIDRILKGARPGELPVEIVKQHELVFNLKTARELGVTIPAALLSSATQVIE